MRQDSRVLRNEQSREFSCHQKPNYHPTTIKIILYFTNRTHITPKFHLANAIGTKETNF